MLVLSRNIGESIILSQQDKSSVSCGSLDSDWLCSNVQIKIVRISGNRVQLGITASPSVSILRSELVELTLEETKNGSTKTAAQIDADQKASRVSEPLAPYALSMKNDDSVSSVQCA